MNQVAIVPQGIALPAALQGLYKPGQASDLSKGVGGVPVLSIRGRAFRFKYQGKETLVTITGQDGQQYQAPFLDVIVIRGNPNFSKIYYPGAFVEGNDDPPLCFSLDGVRPDPSAAQKQCETCGACPHNQWGSKIHPGTGASLKACADGRRLAIVPAHDPMNVTHGGITLLRVPPASLQELAAFGNQVDAAGLPYYGIVTRISWDMQVAYPKMIFQYGGALDEQQAQAVRHWYDGPGAGQTMQLLAAAEMPAAVTTLPAPVQPAPMIAPAAAPVNPYGVQPMTTAAPVNPYGVQPMTIAPVQYAQPAPTAPVQYAQPVQPMMVPGAIQGPPPPQPMMTPVPGQAGYALQPGAPLNVAPAASPPPPPAAPPTGTRRGRPRAAAAQPAIPPQAPAPVAQQSLPLTQPQQVSQPVAPQTAPQPPAQFAQPAQPQPVAPAPAPIAMQPQPVAGNGAVPTASPAPQSLENLLDGVLGAPTA